MQKCVHGFVMWKVMQRFAWKDFVNWRTITTQLLCKVTTPCVDDDHQSKEEEMGSVGELSKVCSQIVVKCFHVVRIGRVGILWSSHKFARAVAKWTKSCDKRWARLISYFHFTCE